MDRECRQGRGKERGGMRGEEEMMNERKRYSQVNILLVSDVMNYVLRTHQFLCLTVRDLKAWTHTQTHTHTRSEGVDRWMERTLY